MTEQELARLQERAGQNDPEALYRLAMLHIYGDGVPENHDLAAEQNDPFAQDYPYARQALEALSTGAENAAGRPIE